MSVCISKIIELSPAALKFLEPDEASDDSIRDERIFGGLIANTNYAWLSSGPCLEVIETRTGHKIGAWRFGWVLKDVNTAVAAAVEVHRSRGKLPLLAVAVNSESSGGFVCIFNFFGSKVIRAINIGQKITSIHVVDSGQDVFTLPSPLRNFDGIIAVGTEGGDVFLIDLCQQICEEGLTISGSNKIRNELNPCQLHVITSKDIKSIESHKEFAVTNNQHLAIHLNVVFDSVTTHFTLKGPKGEDRIHVNKVEVAVSALHYCPQLGSILIGFNFGALQLYNLIDLTLVYTSPVCEEHIPISYFAVQEPADDPRAFCYIWAIYNAGDDYQASLPLAVMYAFSYHSKEYHEGYGYLYQNFSTASIHYQMELGIPEGCKKRIKPRGGHCLRLQTITKGLTNRDEPQSKSNDEILTLCIFVWCIWYKDSESDVFVSVFDLNQWYKEQMPSVPSVQNSANFMHQICISELIDSTANKNIPILDASPSSTFQQFTSAQRLEEHFCPNSFSFDICCLRENDIINFRHYGLQKAILNQIESAGPMALVEPAEIFQEIVNSGLLPLFVDIPVNTPVSTKQQREVILSTALERHLRGWLCKCASEWANGSFLAAGCSLDFLINWAFQRAAILKSNCDKFCVPLFDYSQTRLDTNTRILLNCCIRQINDICAFYSYILNKLFIFISNKALVDEQIQSLRIVYDYYEVLQWFMTIGLLPECPLGAYPKTDELGRISAPYPAEMLSNFYNQRRAMLQIAAENPIVGSTSLLFIDNLIEQECSGRHLEEQWRNDGGNGLYPPPSIQSLLRTYLIENVPLVSKHCVTIYAFLDLAMTLDQERYKSVITYLIKFPAVFSIKSSLIKVTQAFWQLDHGDYNAAMGLLLDPMVSKEDLSPWQHKIVLRSLLAQNQHNFALLYLQVRQPILADTDDVLLAVTLFISNVMLDEAFYLKDKYGNKLEKEKIFTHLLDECSKSDMLHSIIYRSFNKADEEFFLKYLMNSKLSNADDIQVFYHIIRSNFTEAFEANDRAIPSHLKHQGLVGQNTASSRDKLVQGLKKMLPQICKDVVVTSHRERHVWKKIERPTPMSVFVTNHNENAQYKSTLLAAALAKAKQTFNETISENNKLKTEDIPFLRTPVIMRPSRMNSGVYVNPKIVEDDAKVESLSPTPAKRLKLSPRQSNISMSSSSLLNSTLFTPIVARKTAKSPTPSQTSFAISTPHSILKSKSFNNTERDNDGAFRQYLESTPLTSQTKKAALGLSPRKALAKSPGVRFEGLKNLSSDDGHSLNEKRLSDNTTLDKTDSTSSKQTSAEEIFYSPDTSLEETNTDIQEPKKEEIEEISVVEEKITTPSIYSSPKSRRGLKRSLTPATSVRSSPRLSKTSSNSTDSSPAKALPEKETSSLPETIEIQASPSPKPADYSLNDSSKGIPKLRARKSLCRQVLETNALNRVLNTPTETSQSITEASITRTESETLHLETTFKYVDGEEHRSSDSITKHSFTKTSLLESDLDITDNSINNPSTNFPKLSESMAKFINSQSNFLSEISSTDVSRNEDFNKSLSTSHQLAENAPTTITIDTSQEHESIVKISDTEYSEAMDVDDCDVVETINDTESDTKLIYEDLSNISRAEKQDQADEDTSPDLDPEMNNFEITHDLTVSHNMMLHQENSLGENDYCYGQQNTLENVMEENISAVTSHSVGPFEKNVFIESEESSSSDDDAAKEKDDQQCSDKSIKEAECEVIEIGSSSEEEKRNSSDDSGSSNDSQDSSSQSDAGSNGNEKLNISYEGNIYDSGDSYSSDINNERNVSPISESSDDNEKPNQTEAQLGLFQGEIVLSSSNKNEEDSNSSTTSSSSDDKADRTDAQLGLFHGEIILSSSRQDEASSSSDSSNDRNADKTEAQLSLFHEEIISSGNNKDEHRASNDSNDGIAEQTVAEIGLFHGEIILCEENRDDKNDSLTETEKDAPEDATQVETKANETNVVIESVIEEEKKNVDEPEFATKNDSNMSYEEDFRLVYEEDDIVTVEESVQETLAKEKTVILEAENQASIAEIEETVTKESTLKKEPEDSQINNNSENVNKKEDDKSDSISAVVDNPVESKISTSAYNTSGSPKKRSVERDILESTIVNISDESIISQSIRSETNKNESEISSIAKIGNQKTLEKSALERDILESTIVNIDETIISTVRSETTRNESDISSTNKIEDQKTLDIPKNLENSAVERDILESTIVNIDETIMSTVRSDTARNESEISSTKKIEDQKTLDIPKNLENSAVERDILESTIVNIDETIMSTVRSDTTRNESETSSTNKIEDQKTLDISKNLEKSAVERDFLDYTLGMISNETMINNSNLDISEKQTSLKSESAPSVSATQHPTTPSRSIRRADISETQQSTPRRSSRRLSADMDASISKETPSNVLQNTVNDNIDLKHESSRVLRSRSVRTSAPAPRKRSASTEEPQIPKKSVTAKPRKQRAASVSNLPEIPEEKEDPNSNRQKRAKSVIEDYSSTRRITRRQITLLKQSLPKQDEVEVDLACLDPIVLLDRQPFEGKPDPDEDKAYQTSPSNSSTTSSPKKTGRRLRSASQASERSTRSKSREVEDPHKKKPRTKASSDDETPKDSDKSSDEIRKTAKRGRTKSVSSVASDNSNTSITRITRSKAIPNLPEIKEEIESKENPKKRTRKNSEK